MAISTVKKDKEVIIMTDFDRLNRETFEYNNGISRNISPTDGIGKDVDFDRLNRDTCRYNNGLSKSISPTRRGIKASELSGRFNCYR